jgi:hypothetical protein
MNFLTVGERLINLDAVTDVSLIKHRNDEVVGVTVVFMGGGSIQIAHAEKEVAVALWNWLRSRSVDVSVPSEG